MKRGRPKNEEWKDFARAQDVFLWIGLAKADAAARGEVLSDRAIHARVAKDRGLIWIRGGGFPERKAPTGRKKRRCRYDSETGRVSYAEDGPLYLEKRIQHAPSLKTRYDEALRYYRDPNVRQAWDNMIAALTGREQPPPLFQTGGRQKPLVVRLSDYLVPD